VTKGRADVQNEALVQAIRHIEDGVAAADGYFRPLTRCLTSALDVRGAFVGGLLPTDGKAELVALWNGERFLEELRYEVDETWIDLFRGGLAQVGPDVSARLALPEWLARLDAQSLIAVSLFTSDGQAIGWLGVLSSRVIEPDCAVPVLQALAPRTAAELKRRDTERSLRLSEERFRRLVEGSPDGIYRLRFEPLARLEYVNEACARILGIPREELTGADADFILQYMHDDSDLPQINAGQAVTLHPLRHWTRPDGREIWTEGRNLPEYDADGRLVGFVGFLRDVSQREEALAELRLLEESERRVLEALPDAVYRLDQEGVCVERVGTGGVADEAAGKAVEQLVAPGAAGDAREAFRRARRSRGVERLKWTEPEGDSHYECRFISMKSGEILLLIRDITAEEWAALEPARQEVRDDVEGEVQRKIAVSNPYNLTFREFTVLHLLSRGLPDKQIAADLGVSLSTATKHVSNILAKMDASSRTEASVRALREGLI